MNTLVCSFVLIAGIALALFMAGGFYTLAQVAFRRPADYDFARTTCIENGEITPEFLARSQQDFYIQSKYGYALHCVEIESNSWNGKPEEKPLALFCHGFSWTWHGQIKYMEEYLSRGYRVIAYDHRAHGKSGGKSCTYGFYEKDDLGTVIDTLSAGSTSPIVLCGESMGAATILMYRPNDSRIAARICDCAFSDLHGVLFQHLRMSGVPAFLGKTLLYAGSFASLLTLQFPFSSVSPSRSATNCTSPVCLIHGSRDTTAPVSMAHTLYASLHKAPAAAFNELHIFEDATHAKSIQADPARYSRIVGTFLDKTLTAYWSTLPNTHNQ